MKKEMSLVWVVNKEGDKNFVLMGKQAPGKKLAGKRIGFGGKCEDGESALDCAAREIGEELGKSFDLENFQKAGTFHVSDKKIGCFVLQVAEKFTEPVDNSEFVDMKWINILDLPNYFSEMLSGDEVVVENMNKFILEGVTFDLVKEDTQKLQQETKNIFK